jgi:hypothetical protein
MLTLPNANSRLQVQVLQGLGLVPQEELQQRGAGGQGAGREGQGVEGQ